MSEPYLTLDTSKKILVPIFRPGQGSRPAITDPERQHDPLNILGKLKFLGSLFPSEVGLVNILNFRFQLIFLFLYLSGQIAFGAEKRTLCTPVIETLTRTMFYVEYGIEKVRSIPEMTPNQMYLISFVAHLKLKAKPPQKIWVPLEKLAPIHVVDQLEGIRKIEKRAQTIALNREEILAAGKLSLEDSHRYMQSVGPLQVVEDLEGNFVVFEGNGRYIALREALGDSGNQILIEVELFESDDYALLMHLQKVRQNYQLTPPDHIPRALFTPAALIQKF